MSNNSRWFDRWFDLVNLGLGVALLSFCGKWYYENMNRLPSGDKVFEIKKTIAHMKKKGLSYSELYRVLSPLDSENKMANGGVSIFLVIDESSLSGEAKSYFKKSLLLCEEKNFGINKREQKAVFEAKYFKEIFKNI